MFFDSLLLSTWVYRLTSIFLLTYPVATLTLNGAASAMAIVASLVAGGALALVRSGPLPAAADADADRSVRWLGVSMATPLVAVFLSEAWNRHWVGSALDSPARFLLAVPLFMALRRAPLAWFRWMEWSFALGAVGALTIQLFQPDPFGGGRLSSPFLNPIHFGDIALVLGMLSGLSLDWWHRDSMVTRALKVIGLMAGLASSLLSGARGGWLAIPLVLLLIAYVFGREQWTWRRIAMGCAVVVALIGMSTQLSVVKIRLGMVGTDLVQYEQGQTDTSTGIRVQLYKAALRLVPQHPVFGLGPNGFADSMPALALAGALTPVAAEYGKGEVHNQLLHYAANFGLVGALALLSIYIVPGVVFWRALKSPDRVVRRAGLMGLVFVIAFWVFGLTVETFDLKGTVAFYATLTMVLAALVARPAQARPTQTH